jgi:ABC-type nitrate/sulfonate/bicarbonate transport system permease component
MLSRWIGTSVNWLGLSVFALVLAAWEGAVRSGAIAFEFLPAPSAIPAGAIELMRDGILLHDLLHTLLSIAMGWTLAMIVGLLLGFSPPTRRYGLASIEVLRPMPGIALRRWGCFCSASRCRPNWSSWCFRPSGRSRSTPWAELPTRNRG